MLAKISMNKSLEFSDLIKKFTCLVNKFNQIEKDTRDYGTGTLLYSLEIQLIEAI